MRGATFVAPLSVRAPGPRHGHLGTIFWSPPGEPGADHRHSPLRPRWYRNVDAGIDRRWLQRPLQLRDSLLLMLVSPVAPGVRSAGAICSGGEESVRWAVPPLG